MHRVYTVWPLEQYFYGTGPPLKPVPYPGVYGFNPWLYRLMMAFSRQTSAKFKPDAHNEDKPSCAAPHAHHAPRRGLNVVRTEGSSVTSNLLSRGQIHTIQTNDAWWKKKFGEMLKHRGLVIRYTQGRKRCAQNAAKNAQLPSATSKAVFKGERSRNQKESGAQLIGE
jgi:hypothetical protein